MTGLWRLASVSCFQARVTNNMKAIMETIQAKRQGRDRSIVEEKQATHKTYQRVGPWDLRDSGTHGVLPTTQTLGIQKPKPTCPIHTCLSLWLL